MQFLLNYQIQLNIFNFLFHLFFYFSINCIIIRLNFKRAQYLIQVYQVNSVASESVF